MQRDIERPIVSKFSDPVEFVREMLNYRKLTEPSFSVFRSAKSLRKVSPALVSLILKRKRRITLDRVEELSKLLNLGAAEKFYFKNWIENSELPSQLLETSAGMSRRKEAGSGLLNDWLNVYVKDLFLLPAIQASPQLIFEKLAHVAPKSRIEKALKFLIKEGYLRKTLEGSLVIDATLSVADPKVPSKKIRNFHRAALKLAGSALELFSPSERLANTVIIALNEKRYQELLQLIEEFSEKLKDFAEKEDSTIEPPTRLYQLIVNLSPTGGKTE